MRHFNTAGPVNQDNMYKIDPLNRWSLEEILDLVQQGKYFILHAPRQTGKTSCLLALRDYLNKEGKYFAAYINVEIAQFSGNDAEQGIRAIIEEIADRMFHLTSNRDMYNIISEMATQKGAGKGLNSVLSYICKEIQKPVVFLIDEIDSLIGFTLISVLRQLRGGYDMRPKDFPASVILCGVRDIKDYRIQVPGNEIITGGSCFNIKTESLRLGNFSKNDVINLYGQHTSETGQRFEDECFDLVMEYTDGQPWLVNALAREVTYKMRENRDPAIIITPEKMTEAKEQLILERQTHLDQLVDKLKEDRVRRVILPMILGEELEAHNDDIVYCIDLGLIKKVPGGVQISNGIYKEVIPREITQTTQYMGFSSIEPKWVNKDGSLDVNTLLTLFKNFWNENATIWGSDIAGYKEAAPQLVIQAFLQRVVNGGGTINREYALGARRTDLYVKWTYKKEEKLYLQNFVIELKVINKKQNYESIKQTAIEQTVRYAKICGEKEAHILVFDRYGNQEWLANEPNEYAEYDGVKLEIWKLGAGVFTNYEV